MKQYRIKASSLTATYTAGTYCASSAQEAIEMAKEEYRNSPMGRQFKDVGAFRFYAATPEKSEDDE